VGSLAGLVGSLAGLLGSLAGLLGSLVGSLARGPSVRIFKRWRVWVIKWVEWRKNERSVPTGITYYLLTNYLIIYYSQLWRPHLIKNIISLERIQRCVQQNTYW